MGTSTLKNREKCIEGANKEYTNNNWMKGNMRIISRLAGCARAAGVRRHDAHKKQLSASGATWKYLELIILELLAELEKPKRNTIAKTQKEYPIMCYTVKKRRGVC